MILEVAFPQLGTMQGLIAFLGVELLLVAAAVALLWRPKD